MFKKCVVFVVVLGMILSMGLIGSSASGIEDHLKVDLKFTVAGATDAKGHTVKVEDAESDGKSITFADGIVSIVGEVHTMNRIIVENAMDEDAPISLTLELYIKMADTGEKYDILNVGKHNVNISYLGTDDSGYFGAGKSDAGDADTFIQPGFPQDRWVHIVCVSDEEAQEQKIYVDGVYEEDFVGGGGNNLVTEVVNSDPALANYDLVLGAFYTNATRTTNYEVQVCRYYDAAATEEEVQAMYEAVTNLEDVEIPSGEPSEEPSEQPSEEPSEEPSEKPSEKPNDKPQDNVQTFDLGLVSLAAVALSTMVAIKKRK